MFFATFGVILSAAYALWLYRKVIFGKLEKPSLAAIRDLGLREAVILAPLATDSTRSPSRRASNLTYSFGYCGSGFQLGPGCGKLVSELVLDGVASLPLDAFAIDRFSEVAAA